MPFCIYILYILSDKIPVITFLIKRNAELKKKQNYTVCFWNVLSFWILPLNIGIIKKIKWKRQN
jgi:hypothetical protein